MSFLLTFCAFATLVFAEFESNDPQCDEVPDAPIADIDVLSFVEGTTDTKLRIANAFDDSFHFWGAVRLINHGILYQHIVDILNNIALFFDEPLDFKMNFAKNSSISEYQGGFVPIGDETVGAYKGEAKHPDLVESFHLFSNWADALSVQKGHPFIPKDLPHHFDNIIPKYWSESRQLVYNVNWLASVALGFDIEHNIFEENMTSHSMMSIRLSNYPSLNDEELKRHKYRFNPHQDYTGFTLIANDNIGGLRISVNDSNDNILWYNVSQRVGSIIVLGGEFFERWTNAHWISSYHAVRSASDRRVSAITFTCPDLNNIIDILPCLKCMGNRRKFQPVLGADHLKKRMTTTFK